MAQRGELFDPRLRPFLDRARIDCDRLFDFRCPKEWGELTRTQNPLQRFCTECHRTVHLAVNEEELRRLAEQRACVAVVRAEELPDPDEVEESQPVMMLGRVSRDF